MKSLLFLIITAGFSLPFLTSTLAMEDPPMPAPAVHQESEKKQEPKATEPAPATKFEPAAAVEPGQSQRQPSVDEILKAFHESERPAAEPIMPTRDETGGASTQRGTAGRQKARFTDGYLLADRVGRIVKEGTNYVVLFESTHPEDNLGPIKLLPNLMLEMVARETDSQSETALFLVSGEVTEFMGDNYLLLRKALRKRDFGNLQK